MKNALKMIGLFILIGFSFFYTDKVIEVIREEDKIMIELTSIEDIYRVEAMDATIIGNTIIPGLNGKVINIEDSYNKMKSLGIFDKNLIIYNDIVPNVSVTNNKDKFIIKGNNNKQMVSIVFIMDNDKYLDDINKVLALKQVKVNYFVTYTYLINNSTKIKDIDHEFYSYGDNGKYSNDNLLFSNNLLTRIKNNNAIYCLAKNMENDILDICSKHNLYTITPSIIGSTTPYNTIKDKLTSGSIILLSMNKEVINELSTIIDYIKGKGLKIDTLSNMLKEELSN